MKLPAPTHLEQMTLKEGIEFLVRILALKAIFVSSIFNFEIREIIPHATIKLNAYFWDV